MYALFSLYNFGFIATLAIPGMCFSLFNTILQKQLYNLNTVMGSVLPIIQQIKVGNQVFSPVCVCLEGKHI